MKDWISQLSAAVGFVQAMTAPQAPASFVEARSPLRPEIVGFSSSANRYIERLCDRVSVDISRSVRKQALNQLGRNRHSYVYL